MYKLTQTDGTGDVRRLKGKKRWTGPRSIKTSISNGLDSLHRIQPNYLVCFVFNIFYGVGIILF